MTTSTSTFRARNEQVNAGTRSAANLHLARDRRFNAPRPRRAVAGLAGVLVSSLLIASVVIGMAGWPVTEAAFAIDGDVASWV